MVLTRIPLRAMLVVLWFGTTLLTPAAPIRDGGIDPANLGKGDWIYFMSMATNKLGGNVASVTNEHSLMRFYTNVGVRYIIIKAATDDFLFNGSYNKPQFTSNLVNIAHAHGILIFGYNRSYGANVPGEIAISDYVFNQGADGFVWDAESEWESSQPWIGNQGPSKAWTLCSAVRSNWPNKFLAHAPFPIISYHSSFPYKEFGYWCDTVMPQIYPAGWSNVKSRPSGGINWTDVNFRNWQNSVAALPPTNINGLTVYWTNAIKPLAPVNHVYGPDPPNGAVSEIPSEFVMEFMDYLAADPHAVTAGGYQGANFWRADLHGAAQWTNIQAGTSGNYPGLVNNIVMDDARATTVGPWTSTRVFYNGTYFGATGMDTNCFGTNYLSRTRGAGASYVQFTPTVVTPGDYNVYQWHPFATNASSGTPFVIIHAAGTNTVFANQKTNAGNWSLLGQYRFEAGTSGKIRVLDNFTDSGSVAIADGIKLIFVSPTNAPAPPTGLSATTLGTSTIRLNWADVATNETAYVVARASLPGGPFTDIATLYANTTGFTNTGLASGTAYHYLVRAFNPAGHSSNAPPASAATLPKGVVITAQPQSQIAFPGQPVLFSVTATGSAPLSYQWRLGGAPIAGATNTSFTIPAVQGVQGGNYSVIVSNAAGAVASSNATLVVRGAIAAGNNAFGQVTLPDLTGAIAVAAGDWHSLALLDDGRVLAWGHNFNGQCTVPASLSNAMAIAGGGYHSLALSVDGTVAAWGANDYGQRSPPPDLRNVLALAAGTWHSLALKTDGTVVGWGDNTWGQTNFPAGLSGVMAIAAGGNHSLALKSNGTVVAWGQNVDANGLFVGQSVVAPGLSNVAAIGAGAYHSLAVKHDGTVSAWGDNSQGQAAPPGGLGNVVAVFGGAAFSLALRADGSLMGWGANANGQYTLSSTTTNTLAVAAGGAHTLLLLEDASFPPPRLRGLSLGQGRLAGFLPTTFRKRYSLDYENSLLDANWLSLGTNGGNGGVIRLGDPAATAPARFYRVRRW